MRVFCLIFFLFSIPGCKNDEKIPEGIISQNEMRKLMWDLMRADAYVSDFIMKDSTRNQKTESAVLYEQIFTIHSTNQNIFKKSLAFYQSRPDLMKPISDSLRSDEKRVQEYQNYIQPLKSDTTINKPKLIRKPLKQ